MASFADLGYLVTYKKVCSSTCGIPMSRNRVHYQLLEKGAVQNPSAKMQELELVWDRLCSAEYPSRSLSEFLVAPGSRYLQKAGENLRQQDQGGGRGGQKKSSPEDARWKAMHAEIFEAHQAMPCLLQVQRYRVYRWPSFVFRFCILLYPCIIGPR